MRNLQGRARAMALVTAGRGVVEQWVQGVCGVLFARGSDAETARLQALKLLDATVGRQGAILAYDHVFQLFVWLFPFRLPMVLLLRAGGHSPAEPAIIE